MNDICSIMFEDPVYRSKKKGNKKYSLFSQMEQRKCKCKLNSSFLLIVNRHRWLRNRVFIAKQRRNRSKRNRKRVRVRFSENGKYAHGSVAAASFRTSFSSGPVFLLRNDHTPTNGNRLSGPRRTYFRSFDRRPAGPASCPERSDSSHSYINTCTVYSPYF